MVGLHEILLSHSDFIFRPQEEVPWMVGIRVLETFPSLQPPVLFPSSQPLPVSTGPWCMTQRKVTTANIPVNRMARQLEGHRGKCAKAEAQQLKGVVADSCTGRAIAIHPALFLWCTWCTVVCSRLLPSVMTKSMEPEWKDMELVILCIQDVEHVLVQSPRKPFNLKWTRKD
jgi:hypothetical protein